MQTIQLTTRIAAPIERCFLLSLSLDLHKASTAATREEIIGGRRSGVIGADETVTWRAKHFGLWLTHATLISEYTRPTHFRDEMTRGMFAQFEHDHDFEVVDAQTTWMRGTLRFKAPLGPLGWVAETLVLRRYMTRFLVERNAVIQRVAEGPRAMWEGFLQDCA